VLGIGSTPVLTNVKVPTSFDFLLSHPVSIFPKGKIPIDHGSTGHRSACPYALAAIFQEKHEDLQLKISIL
jgi:hypothetical protein